MLFTKSTAAGRSFWLVSFPSYAPLLPLWRGWGRWNIASSSPTISSVPSSGWALFLGGGYFFGLHPVVQKNMKLVILGIIVVSILPIVWEFAVAWLEKRKTTKQG